MRSASLSRKQAIEAILLITTSASLVMMIGNLASPAAAATAGCRTVAVAERPAELLQAFASRMKLGPWIKFHTEGHHALYMSPQTDVRIGLEEAGGVIKTATVLATEILDGDRGRFQRAATFLLARAAGLPEESARDEVASALFYTARTRQEQSVVRGDVMLLIKPVEVSGMSARVLGRAC